MRVTELNLYDWPLAPNGLKFMILYAYTVLVALMVNSSLNFLKLNL
jgi:hypothetical protein